MSPTDYVELFSNLHRIWHCTISSNPDPFFRHLPACSSLPFSRPSADIPHGHPELFLCPSMASNRATRQEGGIGVDTRGSWDLVD